MIEAFKRDVEDLRSGDAPKILLRDLCHAADSVMADDIRGVVGACIPSLLDIVTRPQGDESGGEKGKEVEMPSRSKVIGQLPRLCWELLRILQECPANRDLILSKLSLLVTSPNADAQVFAEDLLLSSCQKKDTQTCE